MSWGIQTWDANGNPNNYGLVPISVLGYFAVAAGQQSGAANYVVPAGFRMEFMQVTASDSYTTARRSITVSGGTITLGAAADNNFGAGTYPAISGFVIAYLRAA
ncbi:hypothetical protein [Pseudescherichia vulneris]|uniref:hypothetical protein n=1 Tax=Pseudescherichia vulneris TaxID=566 RepID=UPI0028A8CCB7|nr:hypothetical protein [Pseudescherichia vulneris]